MSHPRTVVQAVRIADLTVGERNSAYIRGIILDEAGETVPLASVSAFTLSIFNDDVEPVGLIVTDRNILNANGGTYHETSGFFTVTLAAADNPIVSGTLARGETEQHTAQLKLTWAGGGQWIGEVRIKVVNLHRVP